jgi:hypothetical protein
VTVASAPSFRQLRPTFAAEVDGIDLSEPLSVHVRDLRRTTVEGDR